MLALEKDNLKAWKRDSYKRGILFEKNAQNIWKSIKKNELVALAMWADVYLALDDIFEQTDYKKVLSKDKVIQELILMSYQEKPIQQNWFKYCETWSADFGCILTQGTESDPGAWFYDLLLDLLLAIGALKDDS